MSPPSLSTRIYLYTCLSRLPLLRATLAWHAVAQARELDALACKRAQLHGRLSCTHRRTHTLTQLGKRLNRMEHVQLELHPSSKVVFTPVFLHACNSSNST